MSSQTLVQLEDYKPLVGPRTIERIRKKAQSLQHLHAVHLNSTYYSGGVAELWKGAAVIGGNVGGISHQIHGTISRPVQFF